MFAWHRGTCNKDDMVDGKVVTGRCEEELLTAAAARSREHKSDLRGTAASGFPAARGFEKDDGPHKNGGEETSCSQHTARLVFLVGDHVNTVSCIRYGSFIFLHLFSLPLCHLNFFLHGTAFNAMETR